MIPHYADFFWSGPGHAAVLRGGAGDARKLAEPGLEQQDKRCLGGLLKATFKQGTNACIKIRVYIYTITWERCAAFPNHLNQI